MRTISTDGLKPLRPGEVGPWRLGDDLLLRTSSSGIPLRTEADAQAVLASYRAAKLAGIDSPAPVEVVRTDSGFGVVVEYVQGCNLGLHILIGSYTPEEAGREMASILHGIHVAQTHEGRDWNGTFRRWALALSKLLPHKNGERLLSLVDTIPTSSTFLYGDMHFGNLIVCGKRLALIDMDSIGFGHPSLDLAITRSRLLLHAPTEAERLGVSRELCESAARSVWNALLEGYFDGARADELAHLDRRFAVLAEVEDCCCIHGMGHVGEWGLSAMQKDRLALCTQRLGALLPQIEHLDF